MKNLMICSADESLRETLKALLQGDFAVSCCTPEHSKPVSSKEPRPDVCFLDREVLRNEDLEYILEARNQQEKPRIILAYYFYEASNFPENRIRDLVEGIILKPYPFDNLLADLQRLK
jgi:DNA-binding NarL/FixJ family response regulator